VHFLSHFLAGGVVRVVAAAFISNISKHQKSLGAVLITNWAWCQSGVHCVRCRWFYNKNWNPHRTNRFPGKKYHGLIAIHLQRAEHRKLVRSGWLLYDIILCPRARATSMYNERRSEGIVWSSEAAAATMKISTLYIRAIE
jgi:hypothetical protein